MCGIFGATGEDDALPLILEALQRLEYRGYDSAGVALVVDGNLWRARAADGTRSVDELGSLTVTAPMGRRTGIGHTRWATHGHPPPRTPIPTSTAPNGSPWCTTASSRTTPRSAAASRPTATSCASDTDTEVMAHLIEDGVASGLFGRGHPPALGQVRGAFAIAVLSADEPETIVAACRVTPLIVGLTDAATYLASDIPALLGRTRNLYALSDDQVAELGPGTFVLTTLDGSRW